MADVRRLYRDTVGILAEGARTGAIYIKKIWNLCDVGVVRFYSHFRVEDYWLGFLHIIYLVFSFDQCASTFSR